MDVKRSLIHRPALFAAAATVALVLLLAGLVAVAAGMVGGGSGRQPQIVAEATTPARATPAPTNTPPATVPGGGSPTGQVETSDTEADPEVVPPGAADEVPTAAASDVEDCAAAAARFGQAYAQRPGDTRDTWEDRVKPHLSEGLAAHLSKSLAYDSGQLPAGDVEEAAAGVDGGECRARVAYSDGATMSPGLTRQPGGWVVTALPRFDAPGGQRAAPSAAVSAPGRDGFATAGGE